MSREMKELVPAMFGIFLAGIASVFLVQALVKQPSSQKWENGFPDAGFIEVSNDPCQNFCPFDSTQAIIFSKSRDVLEEKKITIASLIKYHGHDSEQISDAIAEISHYEDVDPLLVMAIIKVESNFNRWAHSEKGAMGLMQLMPYTARRLGVDRPYDLREGIRGGTHYLKTLSARFNGNVAHIAAAYNAGPKAVVQFGGIPPFPETIDYVKKVMREHHRLLKEMKCHHSSHSL